MPPRRRSTPAVFVAAGLLAGVLTGCSGADARDRAPGDSITADEAADLAGLLRRNFQRGGADFVATVPFAPEAVLTLTGEVDYRHAEGAARMVTSFGDGRDDVTATVVFTAEQLWFGDVAGLPDALAADGADGIRWLRRPTTVAPGATPDLVDVLVGTVLNLSAAEADGPAAFLDGGWSWQGQRSIDSRLCALFADADGDTVAVGAADALLLQYVSPLPGSDTIRDTNRDTNRQDAEVTVTLAGHGPRAIDLPGAEVTAEAAEHPTVATALWH